MFVLLILIRSVIFHRNIYCVQNWVVYIHFWQLNDCWDVVNNNFMSKSSHFVFLSHYTFSNIFIYFYINTKSFMSFVIFYVCWYWNNSCHVFILCEMQQNSRKSLNWLCQFPTWMRNESFHSWVNTYVGIVAFSNINFRRETLLINLGRK